MITQRIYLRRNFFTGTASLLALLLLAYTSLPMTASKIPAGFTEHFTDVNGVRLHYRIAGQGDPIVLLHGYAQDSRMWLPLMTELAKTHTVIAPDLRGFGQSSAPTNGYTKAAMAQDVHALVQSLNYDRIRLVGHDIVLMVAFLPGVGDWNSVFLLRDLWHFHFYGKTPLALVTGRERIYLEHFWNDF